MSSSLEKKIKDFEDRMKAAEQGGGEDRIEKQHASNKKTARERIEALLDSGTFVEFDKLVIHRAHDFNMDKNLIPGDGVVSGHGKIDGRLKDLSNSELDKLYGKTLSSLDPETRKKTLEKTAELITKASKPLDFNGILRLFK